MRGVYRVRQLANVLNGSTAAGILVAAAGRARLIRADDGLLLATGYRLPVPPAPAFCLGNVIVTRLGPGSLAAPAAAPLLRHEARHATQFACCGGIVMLPLYFIAAGLSYTFTGDFGSRNIFECRAGLEAGGYTQRPLRPAFAAARVAAGRYARLAARPAKAGAPSPNADARDAGAHARDAGADARDAGAHARDAGADARSAKPGAWIRARGAK